MAVPDWSSNDFYAVLGVPPTATAKEITRAFRRCALECHPDTHPNDDAAATRFLEIVAAHDVLGDEVTRREYDLLRRLGVHALTRADVVSSGVRGFVYPAPAVPSSKESEPRSTRRAWIIGAVAVVAALFGAFVIASNGHGREAAVSTSSTSTTLAPLTTASPDSTEEFEYSFSDIDCGPGGWSGIFTNSDIVPFTGELAAVAMDGGQVVARDVVTPATAVPPGGHQQVQFAWDGVPPAGALCQIERVTQG